MPEPRRVFEIHRRPACLVRREIEAMLLSVAGKLQAAGNVAGEYEEFGGAAQEFRRLSREVNHTFRKFAGFESALRRAA